MRRPLGLGKRVCPIQPQLLVVGTPSVRNRTDRPATYAHQQSDLPLAEFFLV